MMAHFVSRLETLLEPMEEKLSELSDKVDQLQSAVTGVAERVDAKIAPLVAALEETTTQLAAERDAYASLVATEDAEDVTQNAELSDAKAATDSALADAQAAAAEISGEVDRLNQIATEEVPAEEPAPEEPTV